MKKKLLYSFFALIGAALLCGGFVYDYRESKSARRAVAEILYGKIRVVDIGEDYKVRVVDIGEDLRVRLTPFADRRGQWNYVKIGEDYKIRFVDIGEDIKVRFVDIGEGVAR